MLTKIEQQKTEQQKAEQQKTERQKAEQQKTEQQKTEQQKTEQQKTKRQQIEQQKMLKQSIRKTVLQARDSLTMEERERGNILLTERILGHQWFYCSEILLGFVNFGSEISTEEIIKEALRRGKRVYVPKVLRGGEEPQMGFYRIASLEELQSGYQGIREPSGCSEEYVYRAEEAEHTLMLMPGAAFDGFRGRIGYGKGFYDRFLQDKPQLQLRTIGVGYLCQLVEELPMWEQDVRPYQVICV